MSSLFALLENPKVSSRQFKSSFGLSKEDFNKLLSPFEIIWQQKKDDISALRWKNKKRKQKPGSGKKPKLPSASTALCFVLYYLKQYPTFDAFGAQFNMTGSCANKLFHFHRQTLFESLDQLGVLPKDKFNSIKEFQKFVKANGIDQILIDATERLIERPKNEERQKASYSGKKNGIPLSIQS